MIRNEFGSLMIKKYMAIIMYNVNRSMGSKHCHGILASYVKNAQILSPALQKHTDTT